jgi:hypothetical protein
MTAVTLTPGRSFPRAERPGGRHRLTAETPRQHTVAYLVALDAERYGPWPIGRLPRKPQARSWRRS